MSTLKKMSNYSGPRGPVVLCVVDGVGIGKYPEGDFVREAWKPNLEWLGQNALVSQLTAHGTAVGMPSDDDMGNSEVGHNAIGCGRVFAQGARLVSEAIASRSLFQGDAWKSIVDPVLDTSSTLHFIGLFSDGNVHSHMDHLEAMLREARAIGVRTARVHILLDGRDVPPTSALDYVDRFEAFLGELNAEGGVDYAIASGGGRQKVTMDRYEANWSIVELGWKTHVRGEGDGFPSARAAIESLRRQHPGVIDQDLPPFVIHRDGRAIGPICDGDSVVLFNFRGDRAIELTRAFEEESFDRFPRGPRPKVTFAGMMQYDGDLLIPKRFLVSPPAIDRTMGEYLARTGVMQYAISETQKFGHVTYFFNGNRSGKFDEALEEYCEIPSDRVPYEERPWMKAAEITDEVIRVIRSNRPRFIRMNYPNGDMVGHTGVPQAVKIAVETVDLCVGRLARAVREAEGILILSADHGNADDMYEHDKKGAVVRDAAGQPKIRTAHSLNPVPVYIYDPSNAARAQLARVERAGISNLAATCLKLLGYEPPSDYSPSLVTIGHS
ncbi:MAG: 2,3-bisphosphoglycerate-independent phosphoglycerate mutase [Kiritimatiellae bacterium]|nr:2,3-bisphosphoglycerate-independent phosphoglycerate mutase [Kiritimatiellia bacterium]